MQRQKGYGAKMIALKLREKAGPIEVNLDESEEALIALIQKRYLSKLSEKREKVIQALLRRGFSYDLICRALRSLKDR